MAALPRPDRVRRILVVKLSSLGDLVAPLPAVRALKAASGAAVDWVTQPEYAPLVRCFADVDRVLEFPRRGSARAWGPFLRALWRERYDLAVDFQGLLKSALPAALARAPLSIGPSFHREGSDWIYSAVAGRRNKDRHAVEECLDVVRWLGWPEVEPVFPMRVPSPEPAAGSPRVVFVPRSRWATKNWPPEHFAALGRALLEQGVGRVLVVGGEDDREACARIAEETGGGDRAVNLAGSLDLPGLASLLQSADLVVSVDSGPMHLAAALGRPVLALFGPTDPVRTGPFGPGHRVLRVEKLPCMPCFSDTCVRQDHVCLRNLFASAVAPAAAAMLAEAASRARAAAAAPSAVAPVHAAPVPAAAPAPAVPRQGELNLL